MSTSEPKYLDAVEAMTVFVEHVRRIMDEQNLSVTELAHRAGLERVTLSRLLNGKGGNCSFATGQRIAEALQQPLWKLLKPNLPQGSESK